MIIQRPSQPFRVVSINDSALDEIPVEVLREYVVTRDISILEIDKLKIKPTVFECSRLKTKFETMAKVEDPNAYWAIFSSHVMGCQNIPFEFKTKTERTEIVVDDSMREIVPPEIVEEVVTVIIESASRDGAASPFTVPDFSWQHQRMRRQNLLAMHAKTDMIVDKTNSN